MIFKASLFSLLLFVTLLLNSCGSGSDTQTFTLEEKKFVHSLFLTEYLWYDQVTSHIDYTQFTQRKELVHTLTYKEKDRWSTVFTNEKLNAFSEQRSTGFGILYTPDFMIRSTRIDAPAYHKLKRGDKLIAINDQPITRSLLKEAAQILDKATKFTLLREGTELEIFITSAAYNYKVVEKKIFPLKDRSVGYLRYDEFTESSNEEVEKAFDLFYQHHIEEMIIDLRYNGGGYLSLASIILENLINDQQKKRQFYLDGNPTFNTETKDRTYYFEEASLQDGNELNIKRVIFLTTKNTASASEALINALIPYLGKENVITIGDNTHGKPVGMNGKQYGNYIYLLINFFVKNSNDQTTSFNGIPVTCEGNDDIGHALGDENETMLSTALYYIRNNACP